MKKTLLFAASLLFILNNCGGGGGGNPAASNSGFDNGNDDNKQCNAKCDTSNNNKALAYLNTIRKKANLNELVINDELTLASCNHTYYLYKNNITTGNLHIENENNSCFTGKTPDLRAAQVGFEGFLTESISYGEGNYTQSIDELLTGIYHRFSLLNPYVKDFGVGIKASDTNQSKKYFTYLLGFPNNSNPPFQANQDHILYPPNGSKNNEPLFWNIENPSPIQEKFSGNPVSIEFDKDKYNNCNFTSYSFTLKDINTSSDVNILKTLDSSDQHLRDCQFALFPKDRLDFGHTYEANFTYNDGTSHTITWQFSEKTPPGEVVKVEEHTQATINPAEINKTYYIYCKPTYENPKISNGYIKAPQNTSYEGFFYDKNTYAIKVTQVPSNSDVNITFNDGNYTASLHFQ